MSTNGNNGQVETRDASDDILQAVNQILPLLEQIKAIRSEINEIKQARVKAHGIKLIDFNTVLRWRQLEDEERKETLENIQTLCSALGVEAQGELFSPEGAVNLGEQDDGTDQPPANAH